MRTAITSIGIRACALAALMFSLSACYMEVHDADQGDAAQEQGAGTTIQHPDAFPQPLQGKGAASCDVDSQKDPSNLPCYRLDDFTWRTSCQSADCQEVKIYTHYMLPDDLGGDRVVHVEAFNNEHFQGAPVSTVRVANFPARRGEWRDASLFLEPGEYYVRAYMTTADDETAPYTLGGMVLVGDQPVGVYGVLSAAQSVTVAPRSQNRYPDPVNIFLDKLFEKPGSGPDTNAHLRISFDIAACNCDVPDGRKVMIELRKDADLKNTPLATFTMASESLLVQGRVGKAEFVTPSLAEGNYIVFAYVDLNGNGLYDAGEPAELHKANGQPEAIAIHKDRTETVTMTLATTPPETAP